MKTNRRLVIEVETVRLTIRSGASQLLYCPFCDAQVEVSVAEQSALPEGRSLRWIVNQLEASGLHFIETAQGALYICLNSLLGPTRSSQGSDANASRDAEAIPVPALNLLKE